MHERPFSLENFSSGLNCRLKCSIPSLVIVAARQGADWNNHSRSSISPYWKLDFLCIWRTEILASRKRRDFENAEMLRIFCRAPKCFCDLFCDFLAIFLRCLQQSSRFCPLGLENASDFSAIAIFLGSRLMFFNLWRPSLAPLGCWGHPWWRSSQRTVPPCMQQRRCMLSWAPMRFIVSSCSLSFCAATLDGRRHAIEKRTRACRNA